VNPPGLNKRQCEGGFTLIEIIVALFVVALMLGVVVSRMDSAPGWEMKKTANRLASTIRYLYAKAASEGLYMRLTLDLEEQSWWVEATTDPFMMETAEKDRSKEKKKKESGQEKQGEDETSASAEGGKPAEEGAKEGEPETLKPHEAVFTQVEARLLKPEKLPDSVRFQDVYVEHREGAVEGGKESIYFFPNGYVEHAVINLQNEDGDVHYSLETNPVSGRVSVEDVYRTFSGEENKP
jgi:prepilin-type N-terminal cleavage/methylation domain-containing protein